ncbi:hypothetical protein Psi01_38640 [Planobispora siamensis]|uniref:Uncharacterized protein n=1 Tax=Planobispora siamensis TaxID=936338 RepID=A0A8J3SJ99_9ACTN|nr:hypothetical protein Psi01_38640 [Planobispora siamensis]
MRVGGRCGAVLHQTEFGREGPRPGTTLPTAVAKGPMSGGPAAGTTWLRLLYHHDAANAEHDDRRGETRSPYAAEGRGPRSSRGVQVPKGVEGLGQAG